MKLIKLSAPGWEKEFDTEEEVKAELYSHICNLCRKGEIAETDEGEFVLWDPVDENSSVGDMLWTACGCEFDVERPPEYSNEELKDWIE